MTKNGPKIPLVTVYAKVSVNVEPLFKILAKKRFSVFWGYPKKWKVFSIKMDHFFFSVQNRNNKKSSIDF